VSTSSRGGGGRGGRGNVLNREVNQLKRTKKVEIWKSQMMHNAKKRRFRRDK